MLEVEAKKFEPTQRIMDFILLATVAGLVSGVSGMIVPRITTLGIEYMAVILGAIIGVAVVGGFLLGRRRKK